MTARFTSLALSVAFAVACSTAVSPTPDASNKVATSGVAAAASTQSASAGPSAALQRVAPEHANDARFSALVNELSEPDAYFFSDNFVSNETSYLQIAKTLPDNAPAGSVYVGVGPEQNFSYIAMVKPKLAFIVDIRRGNALVQLLYKAAFEEGSTRAAFLSLMTGRETPTGADETASLDQILTAVRAQKPSEETFAAIHDKLEKRIAGYGVTLSADDTKKIMTAHRAFFDQGLDLRFALHEKNGRSYPTLASLLAEKGPDGKEHGFLSSAETYATLRTMQLEDRIVPVVGDFAGDKAMPGLADYMKREGLALGTFYTSNVEQYLLEPKVWSKWSRNVLAFPRAEGAVFVRAYLDQGKTHPRQLKGHRTATVVQPIASFETKFAKKPTTDFYSLSTDATLD